jgi:ABC-2 type transport system permease protein
MGSLFSFITKEVHHILRDRRTLLILFGLPIVQLILFGYAIRNELSSVPIAIVNVSASEDVEVLSRHLTASGYFTLVGDYRTEKEIWAAFESGLIKAAVVVEPNYPANILKPGAAQIQIVTDASDPNTAQTISSQLSAMIMGWHRTVGVGLPSIRTEVRLLYNPEMKSVYLFVPGLMAFILMLVSALMTSIAVAREKEMGTMEVLLVSPLRPIDIIIGKVSAYIVLACFNAFTVTILAIYVFGVPFRGSVLLFSVITMVYIVTSLALGVLISARSSTQQTAMMISLGALLLPVILLSGFIFPIESMPQILQWVAQAVPAKWYLEAARSIMLKGADVAIVGMSLFVLTAMMVGFIALAWINLKDHLEL